MTAEGGDWEIRWASRDAARFPTTRWSLVARAGGDSEAAGESAGATRREALGVILRRYLPALRAHLLAKSIRSDEADDLLQGFVADKVIEYNLLGYADRGRGRFRTFLLTALDRFAANRLRGDTSAKRRPEGARVLSFTAGEPADGPGPPNPIDPPDPRRNDAVDAFDVAWAREVLAEALRRMRTGCLAAARKDLWEVFEARVLAPALGEAEPPAYSELVTRLGYPTPKTAANALVTAKRRFEQALRSVVAEYVADEQELEEELGGLGDILASAAHAGHANDAPREPAGPEGCADLAGPPGIG